MDLIGSIAKLAWAALGIAKDVLITAAGHPRALIIIVLVALLATLLTFNKKYRFGWIGFFMVIFLSLLIFLGYEFFMWWRADSLTSTSYLWGCLTITSTKSPFTPKPLILASLVSSAIGIFIGIVIRAFIETVRKSLIAIAVIALLATIIGIIAYYFG